LEIYAKNYVKYRTPCHAFHTLSSLLLALPSLSMNSAVRMRQSALETYKLKTEIAS